MARGTHGSCRTGPFFAHQRPLKRGTISIATFQARRLVFIAWLTRILAKGAAHADNCGVMLFDPCFPGRDPLLHPANFEEEGVI